jgi:hypothetical protein
MLKNIATVVIGGALLLAIAVFVVPLLEKPGAGALPAPNEPVACTMDAKECPDGTYVGRVAPNCEFAPCPGE